MKINELFKIEQHKLKLTNWEREFKYYLSQNIETNLELYAIEKKWYEDYKKAVFSNKIQEQTKINNYNYFQPMNNSHIIYSQNTINPDSNFILLNKDSMNSFSPNITNSKSNIKIKLIARFSNNKMISKIGNSLYYFYYLDENNIIREGFFIFGDIGSNKIDSILNNFLGNNINIFMKHYFKGIHPNKNKNGKTILYHLDDFDFIIKVNESDSNNFNYKTINISGRMKNINNNERNIHIVSIKNNDKKSKKKKEGKGYRWSLSPQRNNIGNNNLIINLNINNNCIEDFNMRNHRSYGKKNRNTIIDCICGYFFSEKEYQSFINQPKKNCKSFIPINKYWLYKFLSKYSYEKIEKNILLKNSKINYKELINEYLYNNKLHDIELSPIPSIQENKKDGYKYYDNYKLITKESYNIFREVFSQEKANKEFNVSMIDYNYIFIQYDNFSAEIQINNGPERYIIYSNKLKEVRNTILELGQYMNTIANDGIRYKLNLVDHINSEDGKRIYTYNKEILNKIELDDKYYARIKEGFRQVLFLGTGYGYTDTKYKPAGKTGTSESFLDLDNDGINDIKTITSTYAMYAPYDNPKYTVVVVSPNIGYYTNNTGNMSYINRFISNDITKIIFDNY